MQSDHTTRRRTQRKVTDYTPVNTAQKGPIVQKAAVRLSISAEPDVCFATMIASPFGSALTYRFGSVGSERPAPRTTAPNRPTEPPLVVGQPPVRGGTKQSTRSYAKQMWALSGVGFISRSMTTSGTSTHRL